MIFLKPCAIVTDACMGTTVAFFLIKIGRYGSRKCFKEV